MHVAASSDYNGLVSCFLVTATALGSWMQHWCLDDATALLSCSEYSIAVWYAALVLPAAQTSCPL